MTNIMEGENIHKFFGGLAAISELDFRIGEGEIVGLIGPNGAGKTTLINVVTGLSSASRGVVRFRGKDITRAKPHHIGRMGIARTFQVVKPFAGMTVAENILVAALFGRRGMKRNHREAMTKVDEVLEIIGLAHKRDLSVESTTIPDRKRLELAKALAMEPELIFLDEVMAGLTPKEIENVMALIQRLNREGISFLVIEHVMKAVMGISHRVLVLHHGKPIAEGTPQEIVQDEKVIGAYLGSKYGKGRNGTVLDA
ncbi:ABC transporter ATP-binding protein [Candidatus Deferrimicrobium sp.]|uniref:ABC transporter ATP-binding protein n=1 Tax=Candidatus Deferrimicrobium sp. TaxID=3060586 RepID=UPI003C34DD6C